MKRKTVLALFLAVGLALTLAACGGQNAEPAPEEETESAAETAEETDPETTEEQSAPVTQDEAVALAVLDRARTAYLGGECPAEGHVILGTDESQADTVVVYAQCSAGNYGFVNGNFEEISGSGAIPSRLTFTRGEDGTLALTDYWEAEDGSGYESSVRETFPEDLVDLALDTESYYPDLLEQKEACAGAYLDEIGREAVIGEYADFDHPLATDQGMSEEVSNSLMGLEELQDYPSFLGNVERVEDGVRWVYSSEWAPSDDGGTATFTKTNYETQEIAEQHVYEVTGDTFTEA